MVAAAGKRAGVRGIARFVRFVEERGLATQRFLVALERIYVDRHENDAVDPVFRSAMRMQAHL